MASFSVPCPKCPSTSFSSLGLKSQQVPFQSGFSFKPFLSFSPLSAESASSRIQCSNRKQYSVLKAAKVENSNSNSAPVAVKGPDVASSKEKEVPKGKQSGGTIADEASVTAFMSQVADLVKLVDSRDIVELQLKQSDYELMIRKKEAVQPPPVAAPVSPPPIYAAFPPPPVAPAAAPTTSPPQKALPALPSPAKASSSSHPPLKSPMAGTFYRSPAPGEPPFVKVGDKVKKGQVICIIEAMKLMNEIEADQSGTIAEILIEDSKPVSLETPLFVIVP
ncbi:biotin carboxyl carrier protein of acetyl-CoA carboxylase, chloroplastic [Vigna radiata var. radiata]|uniref:Biotin carboxyl carrier protein of acetyl-CoA carboxylase n=1 Tax=Vigna radiata var. radiata TaxID=3916 RepID=A0A1S3VGG8_VIGRR|nr:biotin carboxyl carrier protein of acetyl-CoA carboxylase, chloroplastic [Vigna radiata var. radiata]